MEKISRKDLSSRLQNIHKTVSKNPIWGNIIQKSKHIFLLYAVGFPKRISAERRGEEKDTKKELSSMLDYHALLGE